jgi:hypothetical protein
MIESSPGYRSWYPSTMCSPWYVWFVELGYPLLDIRQYDDGEWAIIQYHSKPYIPSMTRWSFVLTDLRNVEISKAFVEKYVGLLDITRRAFWDAEDAKTAEVEREHKALQRHQKDVTERAYKAVVKNPDLMNRIAKFGMAELDLRKIFANIPRYRM